MANINYQTEISVLVVCTGITSSQYIDEYGFEAYPRCDPKGRMLLPVGVKPVLNDPTKSGADIVLTWT